MLYILKKYSALIFIFFLVIVLSFVVLYSLNKKDALINPLGKIIPIQKPKPLLVYTFENLKKTKFSASQITLGEKVNETEGYSSQLFYFSVPKTPNSKTMIKVSGLVNLPKSSGEHPVVIMFRGFVPKEMYKPGVGTQPSAKEFVKHGFITLAPDFLGYGESASPSANSFEDRFQTYIAALTLLSSVQNLNTGLNASYSGSIKADLTKVGIWGHSNGGHIALASLAISGVKYPAVLWAPVSKSFPYSILYYADESDDQGKGMRKALSDFEKDYDADKFSPASYYSWIKAPIEINQGTSDREVPVWWSDDLVENLKKDNIDVTYFTYPGADHNLLPGGWNDAVLNSIKFYDKNFNKPSE